MMIKKILLALALFLNFNLYASKQDLKHLTESELLNKLNESKINAEKYDIYIALSKQFYSEPKEIEYLIQSIELAKKNKNSRIIIEGYVSICKNYYTRGLIDSLSIWVETSSEMFLNNKAYDNYFEVHNYYSSLLFSKNKYKEALTYAGELQLKAKELDNLNGQLKCYELIGLIFSNTNNSDAAIENFKEAYSIYNIKKEISIKKINLLSNIIIELLELKNFTDAMKYIKIYENNLNVLKEQNIENNQIQSLEIMLNCFYADYYLEQNKKADANRYIKVLESVEYPNDAVAISYSKQIKALFYKSIGEYEKALKLLDGFENRKFERKSIILKGDMFFEKGDYQSAASYYKNAYDALIIDIKNELFQDYTELRLQGDFYGLKSENYALILKEQELRTQSYLYLSILLCLTLIVIMFFYMREKLLKNKLLISEFNLQLDKKALIKTKNDLQYAWAKAEESNIMKSTFLSNMSHEIRTPLNSIVGFSDMISDSQDDPIMISQFAEIIKTNSDLLLKLVNDIFDISKIDSGSFNLELSEYDVTACAHNAINSILDIKSENVNIIKKIPENPIVIKTDPKRIQQILFNLLNNSAKFTNEGEIEITLEQNSEWIYFIVRDTGCGIEENMQTKIFERFHKVNEYSQGSGLGLSISLVLANMIGGDITLDTSYKTGARFIFSHPINVSYNVPEYDFEVYNRG